jgi:hypothetical protein
MVSGHLTFTQLHTPVGAFVSKAAHFTIAIPPEDELLSHPDNTHRSISELGRIHDNIPLLRNHVALIGKASSAPFRSWRLSLSLSNLFHNQWF